MKKVLAVFAVLVMAGLSTVAFAADVSVGGQVAIRSRDFQNLQLDKNNNKPTVDTQEKIIIDVNAKADGVKGKISVWNDFDTWGRLETQQGTNIGSGPTGTTVKSPTSIGIREAWINFNIPGIPVNVNVGHQFLALGNEWFLRLKHFGNDAWVVANVTGDNTAAFVNTKVVEGSPRSTDIDFYALVDVYKINDNNMVGINLSDVRFATQDDTFQNVELHYSGKLAMVNLKAQADMQLGKAKPGTLHAISATSDAKYKGNQVVVNGDVALDPVTINFLVARGSGPKANQTDHNEFVTFMDIDPHYTFLYEYKIAGPCGIHTSFCNTTAVGAGVSFAAAKSLTLGLDAFFLQATEKVADKKNGTGTTSDLGSEVDLKVKWKLYDNLSWNWDAGWFIAGAGMGKDDAMGVQGILTFNF
ncbi:MAG: hypothetical protein ACM32I_07755 [Nitrospirota bacterium]